MTNRIECHNRAGDVVAVALVDDADYDRLSRYRWSLSGRARPRRAERLPGGRQRAIFLSRSVVGVPPGDPRQVWHVNGDSLDCRRSNLTVVDPALLRRRPSLLTHARATTQEEAR